MLVLETPTIATETEELVYRIDRFPKTTGATATVHETTGGLRVRGYATRTGVFPYIQPDGSTVWELRPPDEVFCPDSMESLKSVAVTIDHPNHFVDENNYQRLNHGTVGDYIKIIDSTWLEVNPYIFSRAGKETVKKGVLELSCGYTSELKFKKGVWNGIKYDCIQTRIRYNHLAIVRRARLGKECKLYFDSQDYLEESPITYFAFIDTELLEGKMPQKRQDSNPEVQPDNTAQNTQGLTTVSLNGVVESVNQKFADGLAAIVTEKQAYQRKADELEAENVELAQKVSDLTTELAEAQDTRSPEEVAENAVRLTADAELVGIPCSLSDAIANPIDVIGKILASIAEGYDVTSMNNDALLSSYNAAMAVYRKNQQLSPRMANLNSDHRTGTENNTNLPTMSTQSNGNQLNSGNTGQLLEIETNAYKRRARQ